MWEAEVISRELFHYFFIGLKKVTRIEKGWVGRGIEGDAWSKEAIRREKIRGAGSALRKGAAYLYK